MFLQNRTAITKMHAIIVAAIILICVAAASGYYILSLQSPATGGPTEILIGVTLPLTGTSSSSGASCRDGALWAQEMINMNGGIYVKEYNRRIPIRIIMYDDANDATKSMSLYERLITVDGVHLIIGPFGSTLGFSASIVAEKYHMAMISSGNADNLYERGLKYLFCWEVPASQTSTSTFGKLVNATIFPKVSGKIATIAISYDVSEFPSYVASGFRAKVQELGYNIVYDESYSPKILDFSPIMLRLKGLNPDVIANFGYYATNVPFVKALREYDVNTKMLLVCMGQHDPLFISSLGESANGICSYINYPNVLISNSCKVDWDWFQQKKTYYPQYVWPQDTNNRILFEQVTLLRNVVEIAGTLDKEKIRDAMAAYTGITINGPWKFNEKGLNIAREKSTGQIQNGSWQLLIGPTKAGYEQVANIGVGVDKLAFPLPLWSARPT